MKPTLDGLEQSEGSTTAQRAERIRDGAHTIELEHDTAGDQALVRGLLRVRQGQRAQPELLCALLQGALAYEWRLRRVLQALV